MPNAFLTGIPPNKSKSFTLCLISLTGMEINNSLLLYQDPQPILTDHLHRSCFVSHQLLLSETPQHCPQMLSFRHNNLHSWLEMCELPKNRHKDGLSYNFNQLRVTFCFMFKMVILMFF